MMKFLGVLFSKYFHHPIRHNMYFFLAA